MVQADHGTSCLVSRFRTIWPISIFMDSCLCVC